MILKIINTKLRMKIPILSKHLDLYLSIRNLLVEKIFFRFISMFIIAYLNAYFEGLNLCNMGSTIDCFAALQA